MVMMVMMVIHCRGGLVVEFVWIFWIVLRLYFRERVPTVKA